MSETGKLGILLGFPEPKDPLPDPRKAAIRRLREAFKGEDEDALADALDDYLALRGDNADKN